VYYSLLKTITTKVAVFFLFNFYIKVLRPDILY